MLVFGTRPETIKMCPLVKGGRKDPEEFETKRVKKEISVNVNQYAWKDPVLARGGRGGDIIHGD